ncbi:MAG: Ig-like domain-containing protein [Motilibacteraceae bacterium]
MGHVLLAVQWGRRRGARARLAGAVAAVLAVPLAAVVSSPPAAAAGPAAPTVVDDTVVVQAGHDAVLPVTADDTAAGGRLRLVSVMPDGAVGGRAQVLARRGAVRYVPPSPWPAGWSGTDQFVYTVSDASGQQATGTLTVRVDRPPVPGEVAAQVLAGHSVDVNPAGLATDPDGGPVRVLDVGSALHGTATLDPGTGQVAYAAAAGWTGTDRFSYRLEDEDGARSFGRVQVQVNADPDAPVRTATLSAPEQVVVQRSYTLVATLSAGTAAGTAELQYGAPGSWRTFGHAVVDAGGQARFAWTPGAGSITWRVVASWPDGSTATSSQVTSTVQVVPDVAVSGALTARDVPYSYRAGCPVPPSALRRLSVNYWDMSGQVRRGNLVVAAASVRTLADVFSKAFAARFPVQRMVPVDSYYTDGRGTSPTQSDVNQMNDGDTMAFNCRPVTGNPYRTSQHSYGNAIDINCFQNPYVVGSTFYPRAAGAYLDRSHYRPGMILPGSVVARGMAGHGWPWGARWAAPDYQHFSATGG